MQDLLYTVVIAPKRPPRATFKRKSVKATTKANSTIKKAHKAKKPPKWKFKKTELRNLDSIFSENIRKRDGKCQFPTCEVEDFKLLQCSHYEGRARWETRFDEDNCFSLCWFHHFKSKLLGYEYQKQQKEKHGFDGQYTKHMKEWLGETRFNALMNKPKQTRREVMLAYREFVDNC